MPNRRSWATGVAATLTAALMAVTVTACSGDDTKPSPNTTTDRVGITSQTTAAPGTTVVRVPALSAESTISTVGLDDVFFGMTLDDAQNAAGYDFTVVGSPTSPCFTATPDDGPAGVSFTFIDGRVERVDITAAPIATRSGARVGSAESEVRTLYGERIAQVPRDDGQPGNQLVFVPMDEEDAQFRLVFRTDGTTVTGYKAGRLPVIEREPAC